MPKIGGARDYLQFSAFLRERCMARDVFSCSPAVRRAVVATAGAMRPRNPHLRRRLWSGVSSLPLTVHFANILLCCVASLLFLAITWMLVPIHLSDDAQLSTFPLYLLILNSAIYFKMCCGLNRYPVPASFLILVFVWSRPAVCESVMCVVRWHLWSNVHQGRAGSGRTRAPRICLQLVFISKTRWRPT